EALRDDQVHLHRRHRANDTVRAPAAAGPQDGRARRLFLLRLRVGPVVEVVLPAARGQPPDVRALAVRALEVFLGEVAVLIPFVVLFGDPEVDEGAAPDVSKCHGPRMLDATSAGGNSCRIPERALNG